MAKAKKKNGRRSASKAPSYAISSLAPQVLEQAAQGWLQSSGAAPATQRPSRPAADQRLAEALTETLQELRAEITELRSRLDRLESR